MIPAAPALAGCLAGRPGRRRTFVHFGFYQELVLRAGTVTVTDLAVGTMGVLLILEAARRVVGWPIVIVALLFLAYAFAGPLVPGIFTHRGLNLR